MSANLRKVGASFRTVFAPIQSTYEKQGEWRTQKCNPCFGAESPPLSTGQQTTRFHAAPYGTVSANLRKVGASFRRGTVFAPIQSTYEKEATGMENPKMQSLFWCRKPTSRVRTSNRRFLSAANCPVLCSRIGPSVCGKSGLPFAEVPCLHQSNLHMKKKLREWRTQKCNPCFGAERPPLSTGQQTARFYAAPYGTVSSKLRKVGASFRRGTLFAPIQSTYEKEATGMENPKMQSLFWCRKPTSQYAPSNYPVPCSAVLDGQANYPVSCQCKFAESRGFLSPRYRVCTNPIYIWKGSYGNGEPKNAILVLVQKAHLLVRASKLPGFMQRRMGP